MTSEAKLFKRAASPWPTLSHALWEAGAMSSCHVPLVLLDDVTLPSPALSSSLWGMNLQVVLRLGFPALLRHVRFSKLCDPSVHVCDQRTTVSTLPDMTLLFSKPQEPSQQRVSTAS